MPKVNKVAVAYSGGLDSTLAIEMLRRKYKAQEIVPISVDVGQGADEIVEARRKAEIMKFEMILVDARREFADEWLPKAIRANSDYNGYPVSTSMTRQLVARIVALEGLKRGCDAVIEGSTGKGNDQYRMHNTFKFFAPQMEVLAFVRDFDLTRKEEEMICKAWDVPTYEQIAGGDDKTMWCRSIASGAVDLNQELPEDIWQWLVPPRKASDSGETVTLKYVEGLPVEMNGRAMPLEDLIGGLNVIAGRNGVGYIGFGSVVYGSDLGSGVAVMHRCLVEGAEVPSGRLVPSGTVIRAIDDAHQLSGTDAGIRAFIERVRMTNVHLVRERLSGSTGE